MQSAVTLLSRTSATRSLPSCLPSPVHVQLTVPLAHFSGSPSQDHLARNIHEFAAAQIELKTRRCGARLEQGIQPMAKKCGSHKDMRKAKKLFDTLIQQQEVDNSDSAESDSSDQEAASR